MPLLFFTVVSCQKDDIFKEKNGESTTDFQYQINEKSYTELSRESKFDQIFSKVFKNVGPKGSNVQGKTIMEEQYGFSIDSTRIHEFLTDGYVSYTFLIHRETADSTFFENLVVTMDSNNVPEAYVIKYTLNSDPVYMAEDDAYSLNAETELTPINYNDSQAKSHVMPDGCTIATLMCPYGDDHPATSVCIGEDRGDLYWAYDSSNCGPSSGGGNEGNGPGGPGGNDGGGGPGVPGGGPEPGEGSGGGSGDPFDGDEPSCDRCPPPIIVAPVLPDEDGQSNYFDFLNGLNQEQQNWFLDEDNFLVYRDIKTFLENNDYSTESMDFALQAIVALMENPNLTFEYLLYNRNPYTDANTTGDIDNNPVGGYDTTQYSDFDFSQQQWPTISNVISTTDFIGWGTHGISRNCMDYEKVQIAIKGYQISNYFNNNGQTIQIYTAQNGVDAQAVEDAISYLIYALSNGIPVIVGVDAHSGSPNPQTDNTTDHFIVIVGMGSDTIGNYFTFFDNASGHTALGASSSNNLYYDSNTGLISGESQTSYDNPPNHAYIVTQIRKSKGL